MNKKVKCAPWFLLQWQNFPALWSEKVTVTTLNLQKTNHKVVRPGWYAILSHPHHETVSRMNRLTQLVTVAQTLFQLFRTCWPHCEDVLIVRGTQIIVCCALIPLLLAVWFRRLGYLVKGGHCTEPCVSCWRHEEALWEGLTIGRDIQINITKESKQKSGSQTNLLFVFLVCGSTHKDLNNVQVI